MELNLFKNDVVTFSKLHPLKRLDDGVLYVCGGCSDFAYKKLLQDWE